MPKIHQDTGCYREFQGAGLEIQVSETQMDTGSRPLSQYFIIIMSPYALPLPFAHCPGAADCIVFSLD